ncbi:MAG TPA: FAD-dependent oxidoreductase [Lentisphaeria bacterium]|nr:MAG: pyridine nucleotide-disulfide oxidoreductase [Lentisphaerae bacterium GWF2_38_69]HBM15156.1 FAD-dependent oxidoreductase [Lentisphaeria bacterium]
MKKKLVVVGCGFAGLSAVKILRQHIDIDIVLIDKRNHHLFQPLLYQVATGELDANHIATPIRGLMSKFENVSVVKDTVTSVNLKTKEVCTSKLCYKYDYLILACGALHSYFGRNEWEPFAPGLKTLEQALEIKNRIFDAYEKAENEKDEKIRKKLLSFVVVGGGPTGVELAGAIADISRHIMRKDFRNINPIETKIALIEASDRILAPFDPKISAKATNFLQNMGVNVMVSHKVIEIDADGVNHSEGRIEAATVLWGAGVAAAEIGRALGVETDRSGRVIVEGDLSLKDYPEVFVIGDQAHSKDRKGKPYPGVATVALQQGTCAAKNIVRDMEGRKRWRFFYFNRGKAATIGKSKAVLEVANIKTAGLIAWMMWLVIHIWFLCGFQNKVQVLIQWAWFYIFNRSQSRIILEREWQLFKKAK